MAMVSESPDDPAPPNGTQSPCIDISVGDITLASAQHDTSTLSPLAVSPFWYLVTVISYQDKPGTTHYSILQSSFW